MHQFADRHAFLRELIQNAIDAGSNEVDVVLQFEPDPGDEASGIATVRVDDSGEGMTREIIESRLTRLFASDKEGDRTKIGKFGIGFVSVFALEPDAVCVDTSREGQSWRVIFRPDRRYELLALPAAVDGTRVAVIKRMPRTEFEELRARVRTTVTRWCRHVDTVIRVEGTPINEPFVADDAPCQVVREVGDATIAVGHRRDGGSAFAYYNAGLLLHEGTRGYLAGITFKLSSPRLEHTLSRDRVIEDQAFRELRARVDAVVEHDLAARTLQMFAAACREGEPADLAYHGRALVWHLQRGDQVPREAAALCSPAGAAISFAELADRTSWSGVLVAGARSVLTDALEADGRCVVLARAPEVTQVIRAAIGGRRELVEVDDRWCIDTPVEAPAGFAPLAIASAALLRRASLRLREVVAGRFDYPGSSIADRVAIVRLGRGPVRRDACDELPRFFWARRRTMVVNVEHPLVVELLALATARPTFAAYLLVKAFFLGRGLDPARDGELARMAWELA